ncbi:MAG: hypothetical protein Q4E73_02495, partial [Lachnospiraceae bacterium]|nr:hypothetical protein [Lachnospiraceae bacterium]
MIYGNETKQSVDNFPVNHQKVPESLIRAMITIKKNAARALKSTKEINAKTADSIISACDDLLLNFNR